MVKSYVDSFLDCLLLLLLFFFLFFFKKTHQLRTSRYDVMSHVFQILYKDNWLLSTCLI